MPKRPPSKATQAILDEAKRAQLEKDTLRVRFGCGVLLALPLGFFAAMRAAGYALRHHHDATFWSVVAGITTVVTVVRVATYGTDADLMDLIRRRGS